MLSPIRLIAAAALTALLLTSAQQHITNNNSNAALVQQLSATPLMRMHNQMRQEQEVDAAQDAQPLDATLAAQHGKPGPFGAAGGPGGMHSMNGMTGMAGMTGMHHHPHDLAGSSGRQGGARGQRAGDQQGKDAKGDKGAKPGKGKGPNANAGAQAGLGTGAQAGAGTNAGAGTGAVAVAVAVADALAPQGIAIGELNPSQPVVTTTTSQDVPLTDAEKEAQAQAIKDKAAAAEAEIKVEAATTTAAAAAGGQAMDVTDADQVEDEAQETEESDAVDAVDSVDSVDIAAGENEGGRSAKRGAKKIVKKGAAAGATGVAKASATQCLVTIGGGTTQYLATTYTGSHHDGQFFASYCGRDVQTVCDGHHGKGSTNCANLVKKFTPAGAATPVVAPVVIIANGADPVCRIKINTLWYDAASFNQLKAHTGGDFNLMCGQDLTQQCMANHPSKCANPATYFKQVAAPAAPVAPVPVPVGGATGVAKAASTSCLVTMNGVDYDASAYSHPGGPLVKYCGKGDALLTKCRSVHAQDPVRCTQSYWQTAFKSTTTNKVAPGPLPLGAAVDCAITFDNKIWLDAKKWNGAGGKHAVSFFTKRCGQNLMAECQSEHPGNCALAQASFGPPVPAPVGGVVTGGGGETGKQRRQAQTQRRQQQDD